MDLKEIKMKYERIKNYLLLIRLNKPIGIFLLLWPTLWALWLAAEGFPNHKGIVCPIVPFNINELMGADQRELLFTS